jgi:hypothetical protein
MGNMFSKIYKLDTKHITGHLSKLDEEIITEGIHHQAYNYVEKSKKVKTKLNMSLYFNMLFKSKLALLAIVIVLFQNSQRVCMGLMILLELVSFSLFIFSQGINTVNGVKTFHSKIDSLSYWSIEIFLIFFLTGCLTLDVLDLKQTSFVNKESGIQLLMIITAICALFLEIVRSFFNLIISFKQKKRPLKRKSSSNITESTLTMMEQSNKIDSILDGDEKNIQADHSPDHSSNHIVENSTKRNIMLMPHSSRSIAKKSNRIKINKKLKSSKNKSKFSRAGSRDQTAHLKSTEIDVTKG